MVSQDQAKNKQKLSYEESTEMVAADRIAANNHLERICIAVDSNAALDKVKQKEFLQDIIFKTDSEPEIFCSIIFWDGRRALQSGSAIPPCS